MLTMHRGWSTDQIENGDYRDQPECKRHQAQGHSTTVDYQMEEAWQIPLRRLAAAHELVAMAETLLSETVAEMRSPKGSPIAQTQRVGIALDSTYPYPTLLDRHARDHSRAPYGWDVIGHVLNTTTQAAQMRFSPKKPRKA